MAMRIILATVAMFGLTAISLADGRTPRVSAKVSDNENLRPHRTILGLQAPGIPTPDLDIPIRASSTGGSVPPFRVDNGQAGRISNVRRIGDNGP